ncbi:MAG: ABC transporter ATP-binding protein [Cyclobacteriaceae bacterium]
MIIQAEKLGKRFNRDWIFRGFDLRVESGKRLAITGPNGSGKSTLLKILASYALHTEGTIRYLDGDQEIDLEDIQLKMNFVAPYFNLIEEFTLAEFLDFHKKFKNTIGDLDQMLADADLRNARDKYIKDFSSGMKQRTKLIVAMGFEADVIFLDEPTSNLDQSGIDWFESLVSSAPKTTSIVMASNLRHEIALCEGEVSIKKIS